MTNSNRNKAEFLGMSYGAACGQLRKRIMFSMAQELGCDICFRCGERIKTVDELSIEHKKSWLGIDINLFWDLDNIAFSHLSCNCKNRKIPNKIIPPKGKGWCKGCRAFIPIDEFPKNSDRFNDGTRKLCSACERRRKQMPL